LRQPKEATLADDIYIVNDLFGQGTVEDDGTGIDEIRITGIFSTQSSIRLGWTNPPLPSAQGIYFETENGGGLTSRSLIVKGLIENARGSDSRDNITGNAADNRIFGDGDRAGPGGNDALSGAAGSDTIYGGAGNDSISGEESNDSLFGDAGTDTINGNSGVDTVQGGAGADVLSGGSDSGDTLSYSESGAAVTIKITSGATTTGKGGHAAGDSMTGFTNVVGSRFDDLIVDTRKSASSFSLDRNVFNGGDGSDTLKLGGGNDRANGGAGADAIYGEVGNDMLTGGGGNDRFMFNTALNAASNVDNLTDFNVDADSIWLDNAVMPGLGKETGNLARAKFWKSEDGVAHDASDRIVYDTDDGMLYYDSNGSASGGRVLFARLSPDLELAAGNFWVF
jgi:serralysin